MYAMQRFGEFVNSVYKMVKSGGDRKEQPLPARELPGSG